jgi:hypothetical protein
VITLVLYRALYSYFLPRMHCCAMYSYVQVLLHLMHCCAAV